jgi:hypothetical protein
MALGVGQTSTLQVGDGEFEVELVRASPARSVQVARDPGVGGADGAIPLREGGGHPIDRGLHAAESPGSVDAATVASSTDTRGRTVPSVRVPASGDGEQGDRCKEDGARGHGAQWRADRADVGFELAALLGEALLAKLLERGKLLASFHGAAES